MIVEAPKYLYHRRRVGPSSKLYWLNIDVDIDNIYYRRRAVPRDFIVSHKTLVLQDCVLHGIGAVANALTVGEKWTDFDHFRVDIAGFMQSEDDDTFLESRPSAKMIWSEVEPRQPRLEIYIPDNILRHLIELYVTKRIDRVAMFMQIAVTPDAFVNTGEGSDILPLLDKAGHLYFRQTQCELLSVHTSLRSRPLPLG
jgi:hypothetical protein